MKKILILFWAVLTFASLSCRNSSSTNNAFTASNPTTDNNAEIIFKEYEHEFGKVSEGEKVAYVFTFENSGTSDLIINSAITTCGCTVPKYNTNPIPPGKGGNLEVVFDTSGRNGMQTKTISVRSNASKRVVLLKITAEVVMNNNQ